MQQTQSIQFIQLNLLDIISHVCAMQFRDIFYV